jgi:hypothetical protein
MSWVGLRWKGYTAGRAASRARMGQGCIRVAPALSAGSPLRHRRYLHVPSEPPPSLPWAHSLGAWRSVCAPCLPFMMLNAASGRLRAILWHELAKPVQTRIIFTAIIP